MKNTRSFKQQFKPEQVVKISELIHDLENVEDAATGYKVFCTEIQGCLSNGLLLASVLVSWSWLELFVRDLLVALRIEQQYAGDISVRARVEKALEHDHELGFKKMVQELTRLVFTPNDARELLRFYDAVRVPLSHGLIRRFTSSDVEKAQWLEELFADQARRAKLEDTIESRAISAVAFVVKVTMRYQPWLLRRLHAVGRNRRQ